MLLMGKSTNCRLGHFLCRFLYVYQAGYAMSVSSIFSHHFSHHQPGFQGSSIATKVSAYAMVWILARRGEMGEMTWIPVTGCQAIQVMVHDGMTHGVPPWLPGNVKIW